LFECDAIVWSAARMVTSSEASDEPVKWRGCFVASQIAEASSKWVSYEKTDEIIAEAGRSSWNVHGKMAEV
jgi:hypothetical protein